MAPGNMAPGSRTIFRFSSRRIYAATASRANRTTAFRIGTRKRQGAERAHRPRQNQSRAGEFICDLHRAPRQAKFSIRVVVG